MSGAGAQDKLMIAFKDRKIAIPTGSAASTHIIKPAIKGFEETVQNEFFCMTLAKAVGLPAPNVEIFWLNERPYYLVERFDRHFESDGTVTRIHQEDFCQAKHVPPEIKYECDGGPSVEQCFALLDQRIDAGKMPGKYRLVLLQGVMFNYLIGNGDAHAKNFSILYQQGAESLAPFYDLLCTMIYSNNLKAKMAMKIGGKYKFCNVQSRHWERLATALSLRPDFVRQQLLLLADRTASCALILHKTLNEDSTTASPIYDKIKNIINHHCKKIHSIASR